MNGSAFAHVMVGSGIGCDKRGNQRYPNGCRQGRHIGSALILRHKQRQVVPGNAALSRTGSGGGKSLDEFGGIKPHCQGLFHIFNRRIFVKTDKGLAALHRGCDQLTSPFRAG